MRRRYLFLVTLALLITPFQGFTREGKDEKSLERSKKCSECHREIYVQWKSSHHATSFTDPFFKDIFDTLNRKSPEEGALCTNCHAPLLNLTYVDWKSDTKKEEGVTCDYCHSVKEVRLFEGFPKYEITPGVKRGPVADSKSPYHETEFSPLLLDSKFCAGCHEFKNRFGVGILTTFSEWEKSFYKGEGVQCQYCHLPQLFKDEQYQPGEEKPREVPDHTMRGGHYPDQLKEAVKISGTLKSSGKQATVELELFNAKSGHKIPTGIPLHRIVVATNLFNIKGEKIADNEIYLERILGDSEGNPILNPVEMFLNARTVTKDNRIGPKEKRRLTIKFPLSKPYENLLATASLFYELPTADPALKRARINFSNTTIPLSKRTFPFQPIIIFLLLVTAGLVTYDIMIRRKAAREQEGTERET